MSHWIIVPVILPALVAALLTLGMRNDLVLQRIVSVTATLALAGVAALLAWAASDGAVEVYELGNWPAPYGIVLVLDQLSALMVGLTAILAVIVVLYAMGSGWDGRGRNFHALFQFQLMGICGAFLTGDAFNLFVFFEVLLIASYGLMIHGGGAVRLKAGLQYVVYNLAGSTLFLFALGTLYAATGTLNMADLALRAAEMPAEEAALLRVGAVLLMIVFAIKAALVPLQFWLPGTYAAAPMPVAALFAVMTKVGAYAILRFGTLVFPPETAGIGGLIGEWLLVAAVVTLILGMLGVLGAGSLPRLVAFAVIGSVGTLMIAIALFTPQASAAAVFYLIHSTFAAAALFLVSDLVMRGRGLVAGRLAPAPPVPGAGLVAAFFFAGAIAMAGLPPLSGFPGKLLVLDAARGDGPLWWLWTAVLGGSLIAVVGFARAGSVLFWKAHAVEVPPLATARPAPPVLALVMAGAALLPLAAQTFFAGPVMAYAEGVSAQLYDRERYVTAVMGGTGIPGPVLPATGAEEGH